MSIDKRVIVALDKPDAVSAIALASSLDPAYCRVKVGKELFTSAGPAVVEELHKQNFDVFLDLKFHDIPNTVAGAVKIACALGVWMVDVHASGGERMMAAAREAMESSAAKSPLLVAVTVLTSMDQQEMHSTGLRGQVGEQVQLLAELASRAGCDGIVCSAQEASMLKSTQPSLIKVTPGIRIAGDDASDQRRVMTPVKALESGADYLVIGRSVSGAANPVKTLKKIASELGNCALPEAG